MIAYLKGKFVQATPSTVYVEAAGVGYDVQISVNTYEKISGQETGLLYTVLIVREDAHILYGFFDVREKELFLQLINVSGIGASTARLMLSYMKPEELARAIVQSDLKTLERIKGIGKKTAERVIVELKDKLAKQLPEVNISTLTNNTLQQDALNALTALGISRVAAEQALKKVTNATPDLPLEELIKKSLRIL